MTKTCWAVLALFAPAAAAETWEIDPGHATARFEVRHLGIADVQGELGDVTGKVELDEADLARSTVEAQIDARAIDTRNPRRDAHLRSKDFLDVRRFPTISFKSTRIDREGELWRVQGDLTIRGVTRRVTLEASLTPPVKNPFDRTVRRGVRATTAIKREDFGLTWNATLERGFLVGSEVRIALDLELVRGSSGGAPQPPPVR